MKILHINSYYSTSLFYKNLYDKQQEKGMNISVYVPISENIEYIENHYGDYTKIVKNHKKYDRILFHLKHNKILKNIQEEYNIKEYNIIHAHSLFSNGYIAYKLNKIYKVPYIVAVRNTDVNVFFKKMIHLRKLGINILMNASKIIFLSETYKEYVIRKFIPYKYRDIINKKIAIIPNGIDDFWINNKFEKEVHSLNNKINIIFAGRIDSNKNVVTTVKACKILIKNGYNIKFTIIGQIVNKRVFNKIKNESFVNYIKAMPKEELIKYYRKNDIFVMPSKTESFGLVYAEAMSQSLPVIYTKGQGFDKQFEEGTIGYHVESNNANDVYNKIIMLINNYKTINTNLNKYSDRFSWYKVVNEYGEIYGEY